MVEQADVHESEALLEPSRESEVRGTRFGDPRGVVVGHDQGGGIVTDAGAHHLAGMHHRLVHGAESQLLAGDHSMALIEEEADEDLSRLPAQAQGEQPRRVLGMRDDPLALEPFLETALHQGEGGEDAGRLGRPDAAAGQELAGLGFAEAAQPSEFLQQPRGEREHRLAGRARVEQHGDEFDRGERRGTLA